MKYILTTIFLVLLEFQASMAQNFSLDTPLDSRLRITTVEEVWGTDWHTFSTETRLLSKTSPWVSICWSGWSDFNEFRFQIGKDKLLYEGIENFSIVTWCELGYLFRAYPVIDLRNKSPSSSLGLQFSHNQFSGNASFNPAVSGTPWVAALRYRESGTLAEFALTHEGDTEGWRLTISQFFPRFTCRMNIEGPHFSVSLSMAYNSEFHFELKHKHSNRGGSTQIMALF